jgi:hypothetical protein
MELGERRAMRLLELAFHLGGPEFNPRGLDVNFMDVEAALEQVFHRISPSLLRTDQIQPYEI